MIVGLSFRLLRRFVGSCGLRDLFAHGSFRSRPLEDSAPPPSPLKYPPNRATGDQAGRTRFQLRPELSDEGLQERVLCRKTVDKLRMVVVEAR